MMASQVRNTFNKQFLFSLQNVRVKKGIGIQSTKVAVEITNDNC